MARRRKHADFWVQTRVGELEMRFVDISNGDPCIEIETSDGRVRVELFEACLVKPDVLEGLEDLFRQVASQIGVYREKHWPKKARK